MDPSLKICILYQSRNYVSHCLWGLNIIGQNLTFGSLICRYFWLLWDRMANGILGKEQTNSSPAVSWLHIIPHNSFSTPFGLPGSVGQNWDHGYNLLVNCFTSKAISFSMCTTNSHRAPAAHRTQLFLLGSKLLISLGRAGT